MNRWLGLVGIGEDGLPGLNPAARILVETAETLVGGARHLAMVPTGSGERLIWGQPLSDTIGQIAARRGRRVAVLASGDPLWYGVGVALLRHFRREEMTIYPQPSAFSLAAARLGWALADCTTLSLHARPLDALRLHLAPRRRILALSTGGETPPQIAEMLTATGWGATRMTVFEHLGGPREAEFGAAAQDWGARTVADLNTVALECVASAGARPLPRLAGLPDDAFENDGQLTKREVRAVTLAQLAPLPGETLWDIGAGCGSIAVEWLRTVEGGGAIAVERDERRAAMIARNACALGVPQLRVVLGHAPEALAGLPPPDAVFVGGGVAAPGMLPAMWAALRPGGRLVANVISSEGERAILEWQATHGGDLLRIAVSRCEPLAGHQAWRPLMPVTQFAAVKPE